MAKNLHEICSLYECHVLVDKEPGIVEVRAAESENRTTQNEKKHERNPGGSQSPPTPRACDVPYPVYCTPRDATPWVDEAPTPTSPPRTLGRGGGSALAKMPTLSAKPHTPRAS